MVPVIRISEDTYERLKKWAVPLEDRPDDVIQRILDVAEKSRLDDAELAATTEHISVPPLKETNTEAAAGEFANQDSTGVREQMTRVGKSESTSRPLYTDKAGLSPAMGPSNGLSEFKFPGNPLEHHPKARGKIAREEYLRLAGYKDSSSSSIFTRVSGDRWKLIVYSTLGKDNNLWWFGASHAKIANRLRAGTLENVVFLCGEEDGTIRVASLLPARLERILNQLSQDRRGQVKFHVKRGAADRGFELIIFSTREVEILS